MREGDRLTFFSLFSFCLSASRTLSRLQFRLSRLAHIRHGINLSEWFAQVYDPKGYTKEHFRVGPRRQTSR